MQNKLLKLSFIPLLTLFILLSVFIPRPLRAGATVQEEYIWTVSTEDIWTSEVYGKTATVHITNMAEVPCKIRINSITYYDNFFDNTPVPDVNAMQYKIADNYQSGEYTRLTLGREYNLSANKVFSVAVNYTGSSSVSRYTIVYTVLESRIALDTPVLSYDEMSATLSWNDVLVGMGYYQVYQNGDYIADTSNTYYYLTVNGSYSVQAISQNPSFLDSEMSTAIEVSNFAPSAPDPVPLSSPLLSYDNDSKMLSWTDTNPLGQYMIKLDYMPLETVSTTSYRVTQNGRYQIVALGDGINYQDSSNSNPAIVTNIVDTPDNPETNTNLDIPVISYNEVTSVLSWQPIDHALGGYDIYFSRTPNLNTFQVYDTLLSRQDTSYTLTESGYYYVVAKPLSSNLQPTQSSILYCYVGTQDTTLFNPFQSIIHAANTFLSIEPFGTGYKLGDILFLGFGIVLLGFALKLFF